MRISRSVAIMATTRKLVIAALLMVKNYGPYQGAKPVTVRTKPNEAGGIHEGGHGPARRPTEQE